MAKSLEFETVIIRTKDNDDDVHVSEIVVAEVTKDLVGSEVVQRNGEARVLKLGDKVVAATGKYDVFTAKEWEAMMSDSDRVVSDDERTPAAKKAAASGNDERTPAAKKAAASGQRN